MRSSSVMTDHPLAATGPTTLLLLLLALACSGPPSAPAPSEEAAASPLQAEMLSRPLDVTRHGACRMACRRVDHDEVLAVLRAGRLDPSRTRTDGACPSHAIEGAGTDGHRLRIVFAACADETRVVTAIDLDEDWPCDCP